MPDDDDRPRDAGSAADPAWSDAVAPDDISSLAADIAAYHREQRAARRRERIRHFLNRPVVVPVLLVVSGFALAAIAATLLTMIRPDAGSRAPSATPLAKPTVSVGQTQGLVPNVTLVDSSGTATATRDLRPTVMALLPLHCDCAPLLNGLADDAASEAMPLIVVLPGTADADTRALSGVLRDNAALYTDRTNALATDIGAAQTSPGVSLVVVNRNGTIYDIQKNVTSEGSTRLRQVLQMMLA